MKIKRTLSLLDKVYLQRQIKKEKTSISDLFLISARGLKFF